MKKLTLIMAVMIASLSPVALVTAPTWADSRTEVCNGIGLTGANCTKDSGNKGVDSLVKTIVNILSLIVGIASVIMIIIGGLKYVTSNGDSNSISSAKNTVLYALIGLFVAAIAQLLVHFVLGAVGK